MKIEYPINRHYPSPRELEVLKLISFGYTIQEISKELYIADETVKTHRKKLFSKLDVHNGAGLVRRAFELGHLKLRAVSA